jgi:hypothetical protein
VNVERLRASFLAQAAEDAERTIAAAEEERRARLTEARHEAAEIVASARAAGEADARLEAAATTAAARRRARSVALAARLELYEELRRQALAAAAQLQTKPSYAGWLQRLEEAARADLGADTVLELDRGRGGVVVRAGSRLVDYSLPALVDRCVGALRERVEELWR